MSHHDNPDHYPSRNGEDAETPDNGTGKGPSDKPPRAPGGLASGLQPGGTTPGKSPGASVGSIGTGGGSTGNNPSSAVKKGL